MQSDPYAESDRTGPRRRPKHHSFDESVDEPAELIENEPVDIQGEVPAEPNRPVERVEPEDKSSSPAFEE